MVVTLCNSGIILLSFKFYQLVLLSIAENHKGKTPYFIGSLDWLGSTGWFLVGVSFVVVVRWWLALALTEGSIGLCFRGGAFNYMSGTLVGVATIAEDLLSIFLFLHSLSMWLARASSQHVSLRVVGLVT